MADAPFELDDRLPDELQAIVDDLSAVYSAPPPPEVADAHLARIHETFARVHATDELDTRRRRRVVVGAAAVGVSAAIVLTGGLAAASGNLPGSLQDVVARAVAPFGIDLPRDGDSDTPSSERPPSPAAEDGSVSSDPATRGSSADPAAASGTPGPGGTTPSGPAGDPAGSPPNSTVPQSGEQGNAPATPPGQSGDQGNRPDVPPGQDGQPGNRPDTPPGQSDTPGNKPAVPPGLGE